jgi:hypothetical protein
MFSSLISGKPEEYKAEVRFPNYSFIYTGVYPRIKFSVYYANKIDIVVNHSGYEYVLEKDQYVDFTTEHPRDSKKHCSEFITFCDRGVVYTEGDELRVKFVQEKIRFEYKDIFTKEELLVIFPRTESRREFQVRLVLKKEPYERVIIRELQTIRELLEIHGQILETHNEVFKTFANISINRGLIRK